MQAYSDPSRETDPHALPDVEIFPMSTDDFLQAAHDTWMAEALNNLVSDCRDFEHLNPAASELAAIEQAAKELSGFYWQPCFPGCLPDGDPIGPFETEQEALADAQDS